MKKELNKYDKKALKDMEEKMTQEAYKVVLKDMQKNHKKCPDYCMGCFGCQHQRLIEDMSSYIEQFINVKE